MWIADQHADWLLEFMHIYMRVCSCFTAMLTVSDSAVSFLGVGCWVLAVLNICTLIEHRPFHTRGVVVHSIQGFHLNNAMCYAHAYAHWLCHHRQPAPCRPVVSAHRIGANPRAVHSCLIPNCPASATGPGLECRAPIKHGPSVRMHNCICRGGALRIHGATAYPHLNHIQPAITNITPRIAWSDEALSHIQLSKAGGNPSWPRKNATGCISSCLQGPGGTPPKALISASSSYSVQALDEVPSHISRSSNSPRDSPLPTFGHADDERAPRFHCPLPLPVLPYE